MAIKHKTTTICYYCINRYHSVGCLFGCAEAFKIWCDLTYLFWFLLLLFSGVFPKNHCPDECGKTFTLYWLKFKEFHLDGGITSNTTTNLIFCTVFLKDAEGLDFKRSQHKNDKDVQWILIWAFAIYIYMFQNILYMVNWCNFICQIK